MKSNLLSIGLFLFLLIASISIFWPMLVRSRCTSKVQERIDAPGDVGISTLNNVYRRCTATYGIKPEELFSL